MKIKLLSVAFAFVSITAAMVTSQAAPPDAGQKFARKAAAGGMFEVKLGQIAEKNAESPEVKEFGAMMVTDHGKAGAELAAIAGKEGIKLPARLPKKLQTKVDKLSGLTGKAFDAAYVSEMVTDHEKDLAEFKSAAQELSNPSLKEFAEKTAGMVAMHLEHLRKIQATMNKAAAPL